MNTCTKVARTADGVEYTPGMTLYDDAGTPVETVGFASEDLKMRDGSSMAGNSPFWIQVNDEKARPDHFFSSLSARNEALLAFFDRKIVAMKSDILATWGDRVKYEAELMTFL